MDIITRILSELAYMIWDIYWGLALGFILSSLIRAFVSTASISSRLGKDSITAISLSTLFGAISSSCSYAAASMARTLMIKGATWSNAVAFMVASTNLVFEIFIVIVSLLGWAFFGGEVLGGLFFIIVSAMLISRFFPSKVKKDAQEHIQASQSKPMDDPHAHHHMEKSSRHHDIKTDDEHHQQAGPAFITKLKTASGHYYMDVTMVGKDILTGLIVASILMVLVPGAFWKVLFLTGNSSLPHFIVLCWNAMIGIFIAIIAFVCSVGNIVMAAVLWQGGISFGGVIAFILSDLVTIPMLMVFRRYYGNRTMWHLFGILVLSIFITSLFLDYSFAALRWIPQAHPGGMEMSGGHFSWNYHTWLNLFFIPVSLIYFFIGKKVIKGA